MKFADPTKLSEDYMKAYNEIVEKYEKTDIQQVVEQLNELISRKDMKHANEHYSRIVDWNLVVANQEGVRESLNRQYSYLRLPSVNIFTIIYDEGEKVWRFHGNSN